MPASLPEVRQDSPLLLADDNARADLFLAQVFFRSAAGERRVSFFVGAGAGLLRVEDPRTQGLRAGEFLDAVPADFRSLIELDIAADQSALVFGGSLGLSLRAGRLFLRPRFDGFFGRPLAVDYRFEFGGGGELFPADHAPALLLEGRITPRFLFLGFDIGFTTG